MSEPLDADRAGALLLELSQRRGIAIWYEWGYYPDDTNPDPPHQYDITDALTADLAAARQQGEQAVAELSVRLGKEHDALVQAEAERDRLRRALEQAEHALLLARRWLANSVPIQDVPGEKPLPAIAEALVAIRARGQEGR